MRDLAAQPPHWGVWATTAWSGLVAAVFIAGQLAVIALIGHRRNMTDAEWAQLFASGEESGHLIAVATLVTAVTCCALIAVIVWLKRGARPADYLALRPVPAATLFRWLAVLVVVIAASDLLTWGLGRSIVPEFMSKSYATAEPLWLFWIALIAAAPLFEETFFRGFMFRGLAASALGPVGAILITTALWAALHLQYDAYGISTIFVLGLVLGAARAATGSLYVPLAMHSIANLVATIETAIVVG